MCSIYLLQLIAEIALLINQLMKENFLATDAVLKRNLQSLSSGSSYLDNYKPTSNPKARDLAKKAFLSICDIFKYPEPDEKDLQVMIDCRFYITQLSKTVSTMPGFIKVEMDSITKESYREAVDNLTRLNWLSSKNDLIVCASNIYTEVSSIKPFAGISNDLDKDNSYTSDKYRLSEKTPSKHQQSEDPES